jgi:hypothetical protein
MSIRNKISPVPATIKTKKENKKQGYSKTRKNKNKKKTTFFDAVMNTFFLADDGGNTSTKSSARKELPSNVPWIL